MFSIKTAIMNFFRKFNVNLSEQTIGAHVGVVIIIPWRNAGILQHDTGISLVKLFRFFVFFFEIAKFQVGIILPVIIKPVYCRLVRMLIKIVHQNVNFLLSNWLEERTVVQIILPALKIVGNINTR